MPDSLPKKSVGMNIWTTALRATRLNLLESDDATLLMRLLNSFANFRR